MKQTELIPHLFRAEYRKMVSVLIRLFGIEHIEVAEDIVSDTFLTASELWGLKGVPAEPVAWLYTVAKNKTRDYLKRNKVFSKIVSDQTLQPKSDIEEIDIDLSSKNINDSQLAMMFVVCHPGNPPEAQIGLALSLLCGFGVDEIAQAFLTNTKNIYKRLQRAKQKLRLEKIRVEQPTLAEIDHRLPEVSMTLYLLFNEGYYSAGSNTTLRKDLCSEAMRLSLLLIENEQTNQPYINALYALMCFQSSRFDARSNVKGETILYQNQDKALWDTDLIAKGEFYLNKASYGDVLSKFHLEAGIAYWHTRSDDIDKKWVHILQFYNYLLVLEYSPIAALNRTYALSIVHGKEKAIEEAEKIALNGNYLYHSLLGELYTDVNNSKAIANFQAAIELLHSPAERIVLSQRITSLKCS